MLISCTLCPVMTTASVLLSTRDTCHPSYLQGSIGPRTTCTNNKSFKRVVEFAFRGQYENCSNGIKCGSILNWLGVEAYPVYDNLPISEEDKKDSTKLLDAFEHYFKLERNIFQSSYALGSIYSGAYKTQSKFYHKLNSVANDCNFTNKDEIVKFLYLTHSQNTRVCEHLLKELTDTTSLADML